MNKIDPTKVDIIQASFYWKNNEPGGLGFTFGPPAFEPNEVQAMFFGPDAKKYMLDSDNALGSNIVQTYLDQLATIGKMKSQGRPVSLKQALLAALNIMWLSERGFIPNDEFNGTQYIGGVK
jgi:hypothetical protein